MQHIGIFNRPRGEQRISKIANLKDALATVCKNVKDINFYFIIKTISYENF